MNKCIVCEKEFEGRADAKFCSASCRVKNNRNKKPGLNVTSVTDKVVEPVTDKLNVTDREALRLKYLPTDPFPGAAPKEGYDFETVVVKRNGIEVLRKKCSECDEGIHDTCVRCSTCVAARPKKV